jgi:purine-binding chemotaxis protein CheW
MQIVIFELGGEKYAIETSNVQGINKMIDITEVPCAPGYIKGLINLRGSIITIVDPYVVLGIEDKAGKRENIMIVGAGGENTGIIVDRVVEVIDIDDRAVKNVSMSKNDDNGCLKGVINLEDYLVTLIDASLLLNV